MWYSVTTCVYIIAHQIIESEVIAMKAILLHLSVKPFSNVTT